MDLLINSLFKWNFSVLTIKKPSLKVGIQPSICNAANNARNGLLSTVAEFFFSCSKKSLRLGGDTCRYGFLIHSYERSCTLLKVCMYEHLSVDWEAEVEELLGNPVGGEQVQVLRSAPLRHLPPATGF
jgi:hypothetical protein